MRKFPSLQYCLLGCFIPIRFPNWLHFSFYEADGLALEKWKLQCGLSFNYEYHFVLKITSLH